MYFYTLGMPGENWLSSKYDLLYTWHAENGDLGLFRVDIKFCGKL